MTIECHPIAAGEAGRRKWLSSRKQDITASVSGALFGCDMPGETTTLRLWAEKRGVEFGDKPDTPLMRRGRRLERVVGEEVAEARPEWTIEPVNCYYRDPDMRLGATPDFWVLNDPRGRGVLQAKTCAPSVLAKHWDEGRVPPDWILWQVRTEMLLTEAAFGVIAVLVIDPYSFDTHIIEVERDSVADRALIAAVQQFWHQVDRGIEPQPDFMQDAEVIKALHPREKPGRTCDLSGNNELPELLAARAAMIESIKAFEARCEAVENELKFLMGEAEQVTGLNGWRVTYKTTHVKEYTVKARSNRVLRIQDKRENT